MASIEDHSPLAHHFESLEQQHHADELGIWVFLSTEILFFGGLFLAYSVLRMWHEEVFIAASHHANLVLGTINTGVILTSSLFMALAVHAAEEGHKKNLVRALLLTILFGTAFLVIKGVEYYQHYEHDLVPFFGLPFHFEGEYPEYARLYFYLYFAMTGLHAIHMVIGVVLLSLLFHWARQGRLLGERHMPVHVTGLYWHFVDIVWVFLYPLLYLIGAPP